MAAEIRYHADFQKHNFFRTPHWRWDRVMDLASRGPRPGRCTRRDDNYVRLGRRFFLRYSKYTDEQRKQDLYYETPGLYHAFKFHQSTVEDPDSALYLQARLLSGQTLDKIADAMCLSVEIIQWYEALFFNVLDRMQHRDWITKQILVPGLIRDRGMKINEETGLPMYRDRSVIRPFLDGTLKMFSYFGGPFVADAMIANMMVGRPATSGDDTNSWMDQQWSHVVRRRSTQAALQFEVNNYNAVELFAVHTKIMEIERSEESKDKARSTTERHIQAMLDGLPWSAGSDGEEQMKGSIVGRFDNLGVELRDDELLCLATGKPVPALAESWPSEIPPPRPKQASLVGSDGLDRI